MLAIDALSAGYGRLGVLRDVSLSVGPAELVAVLGPNGAGKSTLLRAISGFDATIDAGSVSFAGRNLAGLSPQAIVRAGISQVPEGRQLFSELSVDDNLRLGAYSRPAAEREQALEQAYARFPALVARRHQSAFSLSGGEQQMLAIARALAAHPQLLLLDEPSTGLAPQIVEQIFALLADLKREGTAILLVEQNAYLSLKHADRAYVLENGEVVLHGTAAELASDPRIASIYLGGV
jgi:ABC-type branched-subunit amino acid transport system ATPase component